MRVLLFGATGMVGHGVLREALLDSDVRQVSVVGRTPLGQQHAKLQERIHQDLFALAPIEQDLSGFDACFFCLGASSAGLTEEAYRRVTYDLTLSVAGTLSRLNPGMTFIYVSGQSTDGTASGRVMWARVKGETENALLKLPFEAAYMLRPGFIQPLNGIISKTRAYRIFYAISGPILPFLKWVFLKQITTTEQLGRAMLTLVRQGYRSHILESCDINNL